MTMFDTVKVVRFVYGTFVLVERVNHFTLEAYKLTLWMVDVENIIIVILPEYHTILLQ
jgi:hypothetical protein